jgi:diguanylate cyclase (GGDEF)-like protein
MPVNHDDLSSLKRLHGFLEVTRLVRSEDDLASLLAAIASAIAESLGYRTVVVHLYRPAWDDFEVTTVHGEAPVQGLLGDTRDWSVWGPLLDDRFLRGGAYLVPHGEFDWQSLAPGSYLPDVDAAPHDPAAWHPEDALFVPLRHSDGHLVGILSVDEPMSNLIPSGEELDILTAMADHAALAVQGAQEAAQAARHRAALNELLTVSSRLTETFSIDDILQSVCDGIRAALAFENVCVDLPDHETRVFCARAAAGWDVDGIAVNVPMSESELRGLMEPQFESEGCYLLSSAQALERIAAHHQTYVSQLCGRGPRAWQDHWLLVPLWSRTNDLIGCVWVDDPLDRMLPSAERLQALRVFANQATTALDAAAQYSEMQFLAEHDPLTRLFNRRAFNHRLVSEVARSARYGHPVALALCDLDGFKALNDARGHASGDAALERVGVAMKAALRTADDAFRIGGDEFALILPETQVEDARAVVARITSALLHDAGSEGLRASFGIAVCPDDASDTQALVRAADAAMYAAKRPTDGPALPQAS